MAGEPLRLPFYFERWTERDKLRAITLLAGALASLETLQGLVGTNAGQESIDDIGRAIGIPTERKADGQESGSAVVQ